MVRHNLNSVRTAFNLEGYKLSSTKYRWDEKLHYICPQGHESSILFRKWVEGRRCPYCYGNKKLTLEYVKSEFAKEGYRVLSRQYKNSRSKIDYVCPNGHRHSIRWGHWNSADARCPTCWAINVSGPNSHNWKGGISCEPYCDAWVDKEYKESIKERDNYECQNPNCWQTSKKLVIHHIDYNKKNCVPNNLITLCNSCNARANTYREFWTVLYSNILPNKGPEKFKGQTNT